MSSFIQRIKIAGKNFKCCVINAGKKIASAIVKFPGKVIDRIRDVSKAIKMRFEDFKQKRLKEQLKKEGFLVPRTNPSSRRSSTSTI